jgi:acid phosphatase type 7
MSKTIGNVLFLVLVGCQQYQAVIVPMNPTTTADLQVEVHDSNGEKVAKSSVTWFNDGQMVSQDSTLFSEQTNKGEEWTVVATLDSSKKEITTRVTIANTPPVLESVLISPEYAVQGYPIYCQGYASDVDLDEIEFTYSWLSPSGEVYSGNHLEGEEVELGEWECEVSASDGEGSAKGRTSVTVVELTDIPNDVGNLLENPSFETGDISNWEYENCDVIQWQGSLQPSDGEWMLFGGNSNCRAWQELNLLEMNYLEPHIDDIRLRIHVEAYLANRGVGDDFDDQVRLRIYFYDEDTVQLSILESLIAGEGNWVYRDAQRIIPIGTRMIRVEILADWRQDQQNDSFADDIYVTIEAAAPNSPTLIKPPMLLDYRQAVMKIVWETDGVDHDPHLYWGDSLDNVLMDIRSVWLDEEHVVHIANITDLSSGQVVPYQVGVEGVDSAQFQTAPEYGEDFRMAWLADNQEGYARFSTHVANIDNKDPNALFVVGDLVQTGSILEEWQQMWWDPLQENSFAQYTPVLAARGNHDMDHPYSYAYVDLPENGAWYSFLYGDVFILVLNTHADMFSSMGNYPDGQYEYIESQLSSEAAQQAAFRIVTFHQAPFSNSSSSSSPQQSTGNQSAREHWVPLFEMYDVDMVISGHYHSYQRGENNGITYLVIGGGGSTLLIQESEYWNWLDLNLSYQYSMMYRESGQLRWETYNLQDQLIDSFIVE